MRHPCLFSTALLLGALSFPLAAWQTDGEKPSGHPVATVKLRPAARGDLGVTVETVGVQKPIDLNAVLLQGLNCDWRPGDSDENYLQGTCRRYLHLDHGAVDDQLKLAPLASALNKAGFVVVRFELLGNGVEIASPGVNWAKMHVTAARRRPAQDYWAFIALGKLVPPPIQVKYGEPWKPNRLAAPLILVLFGPALLAMWVRRKMARKGSEPGSGLVWLNWIMLGAWLYWISAVHVEDVSGFASGLRLESAVATLLMGAMLFALPPLLATAMCLLTLAPAAQPGLAAPNQMRRLLRRTIAGEATFIVPLGLFLMGSTMMEGEWKTGMLSMVAAYGAYRLLSWCTWRWDSQRMLRMDSGELRDRVYELATAAKVEVQSVCVLENRFPMEANAFAMAGGKVSFTRGLLENMPKREVDAVIAHEVGHLGGKHIGMRSGLYVLYLVVIGPAVGVLMTKAGLPGWVISLPLAPIIYVLLAGQLSQRNELNADSRAVALTNDPEGTIAALARLARLTKSPVNWGGIQGSILSHPSMQRRVLSVAKAYGVDEARALEILHNPDVLTTAAEHYELPPVSEREEAVFSVAAKLSHAYWTPWVFGGMLISLLVVLAAFASSVMRGELFGPLLAISIFFLCLPVVGWLSLKFDDWWDCLFIRRMRRKIEERSSLGEGTFVALIPGDRVFPLESLYAWDLGKMTLTSQRLTYRGERTEFSVTRDEVQSVEIRKSNAGWCRTYAVVVRCGRESFSLRLADRGRTKRLAKQLERELKPWSLGEAHGWPSSGQQSLAPPDLPHIQPDFVSRYRIAGVFVLRTVLLFLATIFLFSVSSAIERNPMFAFVPFAAPLVYLVVVIPSLLSSE